jgi:ubiquinone/menaquinone biosynthesis C-methylase UbiE
MIPKLYDNTYLKRLQTVFTKTKQRGYELLSPQAEDIIADIGCGIGKDVFNLATSGAKIYGIDNDDNFLFLAKEQKPNNLNVEFLCCKADEIPLLDNSIDKIRFDRVFQHISEHDKVLKEVHRLLKPNGKFQIIDTDYLSVTLFLEDEKLERKIIDTIAYQRIPNAHKIRKLPHTLEQNNFSLVSSEVHNYIINDFELVKSILNFHKIIDEEFKLGNITQQEYNTWLQQDKTRFNFSINLMLFMAVKNK